MAGAPRRRLRNLCELQDAAIVLDMKCSLAMPKSNRPAIHQSDVDERWFNITSCADRLKWLLSDEVELFARSHNLPIPGDPSEPNGEAESNQAEGQPEHGHDTELRPGRP